MQQSERGFSLVELIVAIGVSLLVGVMSLQGLQGLMRSMDHGTATQRTALALDRFAARLEREAASSEAVWITQDPAPMLHFSMLDAAGTTRHWAYRFGTRVERVDMISQTVQAVDEAQAVDAFGLQTLPASRIADASNAFAGVFARIPRPVDASYTVNTDGVTGNALSIVTMRSGTLQRSLHLLSGPSAVSFGVEQGAAWHAVTWRETSTRRFAFGLAQKTDYRIWAEVAYTTDGWKTSRVWCSYDIFGKLDVSDGRADPTYYEPSQESARAIFKACQKRTGRRASPDATARPGLRLVQ